MLVAATVVLAAASLTPVGRESPLAATPLRRGVSNLLHAPAYCLLALLWSATLYAHGVTQAPRLGALGAGAAFAFGVVMEVAQAFIPGRGASGTDLLLNGAGAGTAALLVWLLVRRSRRVHSRDGRSGSGDEAHGDQEG
ncbi:MAG: VanZ family protein [Candidatus Brocadiaceae bacterium]